MRTFIATALTGAVMSTLVVGQTPASIQRQEIQAFVRSYVDAVNRSDLTSYVDMYARTPELITISSGEITRGWEAIRNEANQMMGTEGAYRISPGIVEVMSLGPTRALALLPFVATVNTDRGTIQLRGAMSLIVEKTPEGWKIIHDHTSTATPGT